MEGQKMPKTEKSDSFRIFSKGEWACVAKELNLSLRQSDIVHCLFCGHSDKQIASHLNIRIPTVRTHLSRIFHKFGVSDREELILHIFKHFRDGCQKLDCPRK
jgi:DNA-binding NarL/FixJ family response regulator